MRALRHLLISALALTGIPAAQAQTAFDAAAAVRDGVKLSPETRLNGAQISPLRATHGPQLGDAMACIKLAGLDAGYLAVFFERGKVLSYRSAVAFDHCEQGPFTALAAAPAKPKSPRKLPPHHAEAQ